MRAVNGSVHINLQEDMKMFGVMNFVGSSAMFMQVACERFALQEISSGWWS
jgi:hypothetical protein